MQHAFALVVFVVACIVGHGVLGVVDTYPYVLLCVLVFPVCAACWAFGVSWWESRQWEAGRAGRVSLTVPTKVASALPAGMAWEFPPHKPGSCNGPETMPEARVPD